MFKIFGAIALILISSSVFAQQAETVQRPYGMAFGGQMSIMCNDSDIVQAYLTEKRKQIIVAYGIKESSMGTAQVVVSTWVNPKTKEFSIVQQAIQGISCIIVTGSDFIIDFKFEDKES